MPGWHFILVAHSDNRPAFPVSMEVSPEMSLAILKDEGFFSFPNDPADNAVADLSRIVSAFRGGRLPNKIQIAAHLP